MASNQSTDISATQSKIKPQDVGWQFVPQYYNFVNSQPHRLHCFYNKRSTFIHGEEGEDVTPAYGQQEIHDRILQIGYNQCKVYIHSMDSQSSADGGIIILVLGELCNNNQSWRKFSQTFFLAEQPGGYFVLNDIFRYLREDVDEEEEVSEASQPEPSQPKVQDKLPEETKVTQEPAIDPTPEPAPATAPAAVVPTIVPVEALVASIPDKDVAPEQRAPAVEEPTTAVNPPVEEAAASISATESVPSPAPTPSVSAPKEASPVKAAPKAAAPIINGNARSSAAAPAQPAAPPKPKTWASMAASNMPNTAWGKPPVTTASPSSSTPAPAAPAAPAVPAAPATKKEDKPATSGSGQQQKRQPQQPQQQRQDNVDISKIQTAHCFVKLPNWSPNDQNSSEYISETELSKIASKFGEIKSVEIVKSKACAFVEFVRVDSARKAVQHSLPIEQGGEGGTKFPQGTLFFEPRKEKDERSKPKSNRTGGQGQGGQQRQSNGGPGASRGGRGSRGRGGQTNQGERQSK
ncbi:uncharacterized protein L203_100420 [Cryptococcus depauperatus CBS 7841]|uniref:Uncharacterized protein n=1 Tax=Cryptococcus depauperatus CBS 7841 TaxID=1295531 RepID=A0A1E3I065_9TREE|nr:RAN protein binding protein [Cryptococcus depauperatus CBS 7841]